MKPNFDADRAQERARPAKSSAKASRSLRPHLRFRHAFSGDVLKGRRAVLWFWKREWSSRKSNAGMSFEISDFVPLQYTKGVGNYPIMWLKTEEFSKLQVRESSEDFARALRSTIAPELLKKWDHHEAVLAEAPLGHECTEVPEAERVRLMTQPDALPAILLARVDECLELVPAIDATLKKMTRR